MAATQFYRQEIGVRSSPTSIFSLSNSAEKQFERYAYQEAYEARSYSATRILAKHADWQEDSATKTGGELHFTLRTM